VHFTAFCLGGAFSPGHGVQSSRAVSSENIQRGWILSVIRT